MNIPNSEISLMDIIRKKLPSNRESLTLQTPNCFHRIRYTLNRLILTLISHFRMESTGLTMFSCRRRIRVVYPRCSFSDNPAATGAFSYDIFAEDSRYMEAQSLLRLKILEAYLPEKTFQITVEKGSDFLAPCKLSKNHIKNSKIT